MFFFVFFVRCFGCVLYVVKPLCYIVLWITLLCCVIQCHVMLYCNMFVLCYISRLITGLDESQKQEMLRSSVTRQYYLPQTDPRNKDNQIRPKMALYFFIFSLDIIVQCKWDSCGSSTPPGGHYRTYLYDLQSLS